LSPATNEHEPAASDGIADDVAVLLGINEGQAGVAVVIGYVFI
jgi:hypothetical protein